MTEAIGYTRLSQESDTSIERQKRHIREYVDGRGFELVDIYDDGERSSGFETESREEYQRVRQLVQEGDIDAVVVNDKRRLARDFDETMRLILDLREFDVQPHTYEEGEMDITDPTQAAIEVLKAASEHEAKLKEIERAREAVAERLSNGYYQGRPPYGLRFDDRGEYLEPGEGFEDVMDALELRDRGESYRDINDKTGISLGTLNRVFDRREDYEQFGRI